jgi:hypothetical protein
MEKKRGRGQRERALNLHDTGELIVSDVGEVLVGTLATNTGTNGRKTREGEGDAPERERVGQPHHTVRAPRDGHVFNFPKPIGVFVS